MLLQCFLCLLMPRNYSYVLNYMEIKLDMSSFSPLLPVVLILSFQVRSCWTEKIPRGDRAGCHWLISLSSVPGILFHCVLVSITQECCHFCSFIGALSILYRVFHFGSTFSYFPCKITVCNISKEIKYKLKYLYNLLSSNLISKM